MICGKILPLFKQYKILPMYEFPLFLRKIIFGKVDSLTEMEVKRNES